MTDGDFIFSHPDINKIQCKDCKFKDKLEWEGKIIQLPGAPNCEKYPKGTPKPNGILFRKYDVSKHERECDGHYIKCQYYEPEN